ncbi:hypothetical protein KUCAC02_027493, partial [Chaenocephalus aceratus]
EVGQGAPQRSTTQTATLCVCFIHAMYKSHSECPRLQHRAWHLTGEGYSLLVSLHWQTSHVVG